MGVVSNLVSEHSLCYIFMVGGTADLIQKNEERETNYGYDQTSPFQFPPLRMNKSFGPDSIIYIFPYSLQRQDNLSFSIFECDVGPFTRAHSSSDLFNLDNNVPSSI
jgi:hypothetical protein